MSSHTISSAKDFLKLKPDQILSLETEQVLPYIKKAFETRNTDDIAGVLYLTRYNPVVFGEVFCVLPKVGSGIRLNKAQKLLLKAFFTNHYVYTIGSRQVGKTTVLELLPVHLMAHFESYPVAFVTLTDKQATDNINNIKGIAENLPALWPQIGKPTRGRRVTLTNSSYTLVIPLQKTRDVAGQIKGLSPYLLIVDEFPNLRRNRVILSEGVPALQTRFILAKQKNYPYGIILAGNAVELGTDNAIFAYKLWMQTINKKTEYVPIVFYYRDLLPEKEAERILESARSTGLSERDILVQYECMFLPASNALLTDVLIQTLKPQKPITVVYPNNPIPVKLYAKPKDIYETFVVIGVDTATMYGEDYYTITGIDFFTHEQLFEWHGKQPVDSIIEVLDYIVTYIAPHSTVVIERNQGEHLIEFLLAKDGKWSKYLYSTKPSKQSKKASVYTDTRKYGFWTDRRKKKYMFSLLVSELQKDPSIVKSEELYRELLLVQVKQSGQIGVDPEYGHDDAVMAFAIALYVAIAEDKEVFDMYADTIVSLPKYKEQMNTIEANRDFVDRELLHEIDTIVTKEKGLIQEAINRSKTVSGNMDYETIREQVNNTGTRRPSDELLDLML